MVIHKINFVEVQIKRNKPLSTNKRANYKNNKVLQYFATKLGIAFTNTVNVICQVSSTAFMSLNRKPENMNQFFL